MQSHVPKLEEKVLQFANRGELVKMAWETFERDSLMGAPWYQRIEMKKAFYLGTQFMFTSLALISDQTSEDDVENIFPKIELEINSFINHVIEKGGSLSLL